MPPGTRFTQPACRRYVWSDTLPFVITMRPFASEMYDEPEGAVPKLMFGPGACRTGCVDDMGIPLERYRYVSVGSVRCNRDGASGGAVTIRVVRSQLVIVRRAGNGAVVVEDRA